MTTTAEPLTLAEAQRIAASIVGAVTWNGAEGRCTCPGIGKHTTANAATDCKVVAERIGTLAPGIYCYHGSCRDEVDAASFALRSALGKRSPSAAPIMRSTLTMPKRPAPKFDPAKLEKIARKLDGADADWFAARSPKRPDNRTPASFLHELYAPGEKVIVFDVFESQGQAVWTCMAPPFDARELDAFRTGKPQGVWFLCNPVTGEFLPNDSGKPSRRSWQNVTSWRYMILESDTANPEHWLAALAQLPLPIAAIYTSGGKSIHALVRINAASKQQWDDTADKLKPMLVTLGADRKAISAVRLTRLPGCERAEKRSVQTLLYLNGSPDLTPIADRRPIAPTWADYLPADQDGNL
jgi:hypothetical protein